MDLRNYGVSNPSISSARGSLPPEPSCPAPACLLSWGCSDVQIVCEPCGHGCPAQNKMNCHTPFLGKVLGGKSSSPSTEIALIAYSVLYGTQMCANLFGLPSKATHLIRFLCWQEKAVSSPLRFFLAGHIYIYPLLKTSP